MTTDFITEPTERANYCPVHPNVRVVAYEFCCCLKLQTYHVPCSYCDYAEVRQSFNSSPVARSKSSREREKVSINPKRRLSRNNSDMLVNYSSPTNSERKQPVSVGEATFEGITPSEQGPRVE
jgi:hypothetical protein